MNWDAWDFVFAGALTTVCALFYLFVRARKPDNGAYKSAVGLAVATAFVLVWVNGAVGIIGSENNDANMMYAGVLAVGVVGAVIARFQPAGMARAMLATALAQVLVAAIAVLAGFAPEGGIGDVLMITAFFGLLWVGSAGLFRRAAQQEVLTAAE